MDISKSTRAATKTKAPYVSPYCRVSVTLADKELKEESPTFNFVNHPLTVGSAPGSSVRISGVDPVVFRLSSLKTENKVKRHFLVCHNSSISLDVSCG